MALFTPRGLKIRLPIDYAFGLMNRLYPRVKAFDIFRTTEAFEVMPSIWTTIVGIILFITRQSIITIVIVTLVVQVYFHFTRISGLIPGKICVSIPRALSIFHGYFIYTITVMLIGWFTVGWRGIIAFFAGKLIASIINLIISNINETRIHKEIGIAVTMSEINFLNAYRYHAKIEKGQLDFAVKKEELLKDNWSPCFDNLVKEWPIVVQRFTKE